MNTLTKLQAINSMLSLINEAPVNALTDDQTSDVALALSTLDAVSREVQREGWVFNTVYDFTLTPNEDDEIDIPENCFRAEFTVEDNQDIFPIQIGSRLYDRVNNRFTFTRSVVARQMVMGHEFESLPESMREFVAIVAGRRLQREVVGSGDLEALNSEQEQRARIAMKREDNRLSKHSMRYSPGISYVTRRTFG